MMKDNEKQIEEMTKIIDRAFENGSVSKGKDYTYPVMIRNLAEELLKHYQPKIIKDQQFVVLSMEVINNADYFYVKDGELIPVEKGRGKFITTEWYTELLMKMPLGHELAKERKETAEKYDTFVHALICKYNKGIDDSVYSEMHKKADEFAKQFGVEIPIDDNCEYYDKANKRCNGAKCTPECYCNGHKSECTEYPETRKG